ncbi:MAG: AbrB/MazE/SpoVT family DNA-binding domain-containing protein [Candidatus Lokiarchaeota archaeon]|nr:AbrB/MazE/SpoVT family DNA-binding domain-containing protein [Candidatus Lokiarchaeota archaeon]
MEIKYCRLSTKGQLTIPKEFREKLNIHAGDELILYLKDERIIVKPKALHFGMLRGLLREEIDIKKANDFLKSEREKWRL